MVPGNWQSFYCTIFLKQNSETRGPMKVFIVTTKQLDLSKRGHETHEAKGKQAKLGFTF